MLSLYVLKPPTLIDSWHEIGERGKYALKSNSQHEVIFFGIEGYYCLAHRALETLYNPYTCVRTPKDKRAKFWRTKEAAIRYIEKELTKYWESHGK